MGPWNVPKTKAKNQHSEEMWRRWYRFLNSKVETSSLPRRQRIQVEFLIPAKGTDVSSRRWEKSIAIKASCHTPGRKRMAPETQIFCRNLG